MKLAMEISSHNYDFITHILWPYFLISLEVSLKDLSQIIVKTPLKVLTKMVKKKKTSCFDAISNIISISAIPMVLFTSALNIVTANTKGRKMLRSCRSIHPVVRKSVFDMEQVTRTIRFTGKTLALRSCPIFEKGEVTGALVTARENKVKRRRHIKGKMGTK